MKQAGAKPPINAPSVIAYPHGCTRGLRLRSNALSRSIRRDTLKLLKPTVRVSTCLVNFSSFSL